MKLVIAALLLFIAVAFASLDLHFLAFATIAVLVLLAIADLGEASKPVLLPDSVVPAAAASGGSDKLKVVTITTAKGKTKTKIIDFVDKDENKWKAPGKPESWGKTSYEEFGSGMAQVASAPFKTAKWVWDLFSGK